MTGQPMSWLGSVPHDQQSSKAFRTANLALCNTALAFAEGRCSEEILFHVARLFWVVDAVVLAAECDPLSASPLREAAELLIAAEERLRAAAHAFLQLAPKAAGRLRAAAGVYADAWDVHRAASLREQPR